MNLGVQRILLTSRRNRLRQKAVWSSKCKKKRVQELKVWKTSTCGSRSETREVSAGRGVDKDAGERKDDSATTRRELVNTLTEK